MIKRKGEFVVSDIDGKPSVDVTTLYLISATEVGSNSGWSHINHTLVDSVVEFLRLVGPGSTTRIHRKYEIKNSSNIFAYHHHCRLLL